MISEAALTYERRARPFARGGLRVTLIMLNAIQRGILARRREKRSKSCILWFDCCLKNGKILGQAWRLNPQSCIDTPIRRSARPIGRPVSTIFVSGTGPSTGSPTRCPVRLGFRTLGESRTGRTVKCRRDETGRCRSGPAGRGLRARRDIVHG